jgi:apolipoprotein N-acyltransferase
MKNPGYRQYFFQRLLLMFLLGGFSGAVMLIGWLPSKAWYLLFVAISPLFFLVDLAKKWFDFPSLGIFFIWIAMIIWNLDVLWISEITLAGALLTILINSLIMSLPFLLYLMIRISPGLLYGHLLIAFVWIYVELFQHYWVMGFPWFTLGYGIAHQPWLIQWYAWLGVLGGSAWILIVNILIYHLLRGIFIASIGRITFISLLLTAAVLLPVLVSGVIYRKYAEHGDDVRVAALYTNLDVYDTKYQMKNDALIERYLEQSWQAGADTTDILLWPETAIPHGIWLTELQTDSALNLIRVFMKQNKMKQVVTGAVVKEKVLQPVGAPSEKWDTVTGIWYQEYNGALFLSSGSDSIMLKSKYRCVPFTEHTPDVAITRFIGKMIPSLAGYTFAISDDHGHNSFLTHDSTIEFLPLICYETAFCTASADVSNHASIILLLMNEGWYNNSKVASQFMYFSAARAIENRRAVVRSSNSGIAGVINQKGEIVTSSSGLGSNVITAIVKANQNSTFFNETSLLLLLLPLTFIIMIFVMILTE